MKEAWLAFIVACSSPTVCDGTKRYQDKANYSVEACREDGWGWAMQMKALTGKDYGFGCLKMDYQPPEVKP